MSGSDRSSELMAPANRPVPRGFSGSSAVRSRTRTIDSTTSVPKNADGSHQHQTAHEGDHHVDSDSATRPDRSCALVAVDVVEAVIHTGAYAGYILFYKTVVSKPPDSGEKGAVTQLYHMQLNFTVPFFLNVVGACFVLIFTTVYLLINPETKSSTPLGRQNANLLLVTTTEKNKNKKDDDEDQVEEQEAPTCWQRFSATRYCGLPVPLLIANVVLNALNGSSYLMALSYLPVTVAESIMMTGPAVSIITSSALQPNIKYNKWIWLSVFPLVIGGILAAWSGTAGSEGGGGSEKAVQENRPAGGVAKMYTFGIMWALIAVLSRAFRIIIVDLIVGEYEQQLPTQEESLEDNVGGAGEGKDKDHSTSTVRPLVDQAHQEDEDEDENQHLLQGKTTNYPSKSNNTGRRLERIDEDQTHQSVSDADAEPLPNAVRILQLILPYTISIYLILSLIFERVRWSLYSGKNAFEIHPIDAAKQSFWLPAAKIEVMTGAERSWLAGGLACFGVMSSLWLITEFRLIQHCGSYTVAIFANANRAVAALVAVLVLKEKLAPIQIVGICLIGVGLIMKFGFGEAYTIDLPVDVEESESTDIPREQSALSSRMRTRTVDGVAVTAPAMFSGEAVELSDGGLEGAPIGQSERRKLKAELSLRELEADSGLPVRQLSAEVLPARGRRQVRQRRPGAGGLGGTPGTTQAGQSGPTPNEPSSSSRGY